MTLPGPAGSTDARRALLILERMLALLGELEDVALDKRASRAEERTVWGFTQIALGSLTTTLAPNRPQRGASSALLDDVAAWTVDGFAVAEEQSGLPPRWDHSAADTGAHLAHLLGLLPSDGMRVELLRDGQSVREVVVTRRAEEHLRAGLKERRHSIGSAIGRLDTATLHDRREATLWLERTGERVKVLFGDDQIDLIRQAWGKRVEVSGRLTRDAADRLFSVRMRSLEILREAGDGPPLAGLVGLDPHLTGGRTPEEHLGEIRGAS